LVRYTSTITSLSCSRNGVDVSLTEIEDILEEASSFYAFLYSDKLTDVQKKEASPYLKKNVSRTLSEAQMAFCGHSISIEELGRALKKLPSGKAPGIDGLPAEFFKRYWYDLKSDFQSVLECSFKSGVLPDSMKLSVITLIFKKDSRADLKNYRPISLLCTDYKMIAKCLAERMKTILPSLIASDQTGFMKDCYMAKISLSLDVQENLSRDYKPGLCFQADWEKAYNLVDRSFLKTCLEQFGFGPVFCRWFSILHKNTLSKLTINSFLGSSFSLRSGVRQGCPWSPFLFLCAVEPLACALRESSLHGLILPGGKRLVYSGYADDTSVYLKDASELDSVLHIFNEYSKVSGMKLNIGKCSLLPFGSSIGEPAPANCPVRWLTDSSEFEKLLGVPIAVEF
jgi:hypothetical protein